MWKRAILLSAVSALALVALATPAAGGSSRIFGVEDCGKPEVEPDRIVFACADFGLFANHLDWTHWGHRRATAEGVLHAKVCKPDCASGYFKDYPVTVTLHKIKTWSCNAFRARFYRKVKLSFPGDRPPRVGAYVHSAFACF